MLLQLIHPTLTDWLIFIFLVLVLSAIGLYSFYSFRLVKESLLSRLRKIALILFVLVYIILTGQFLASYFLIYNSSLHSTWNEGFPELMENVEEYRGDYDKVIISTQTPEAYIFFLFYSKYLPQNIQNQNKDDSHTQKIGNVYFGADLGNIDLDKESVLFVTSAKQEHKDSTFIVRDWEGKPIWQGYELEDFD